MTRSLISWFNRQEEVKINPQNKCNNCFSKLFLSCMRSRSCDPDVYSFQFFGPSCSPWLKAFVVFGSGSLWQTETSCSVLTPSVCVCVCVGARSVCSLVCRPPWLWVPCPPLCREQWCGYVEAGGSWGLRPASGPPSARLLQFFSVLKTFISFFYASSDFFPMIEYICIPKHDGPAVGCTDLQSELFVFKSFRGKKSCYLVISINK